MGREQWGHGFHAGVKAAEQAGPRYLLSFNDNGDLSGVFQVHGIHDSIYTIEELGYVDIMIAVNRGREPPFDNICVENVEECTLDNLHNPKPFYSWAAVCNEVMKDMERRKVKS